MQELMDDCAQLAEKDRKGFMAALAELDCKLSEKGQKVTALEEELCLRNETISKVEQQADGYRLQFLKDREELLRINDKARKEAAALQR
jgi:hypothetical protein